MHRDRRAAVATHKEACILLGFALRKHQGHSSQGNVGRRVKHPVLTWSKYGRKASRISFPPKFLRHPARWDEMLDGVPIKGKERTIPTRGIGAAPVRFKHPASLCCGKNRDLTACLPLYRQDRLSPPTTTGRLIKRASHRCQLRCQNPAWDRLVSAENEGIIPRRLKQCGLSLPMSMGPVFRALPAIAMPVCCSLDTRSAQHHIAGCTGRRLPGNKGWS